MTLTHSLRRPKSRAWHAFFIALAMAFLLFLPFLIIDKGLFIYYGDFNVQQIPFYRMAHDAVRSGNIFWNWNTDLGANFIGSYSFYLLGSPFFWLTLPFPSAAVPYLMAPLLMLKFALSSLTAYAYLRRFVRPDFAVMGGLLYAFSGFSIYNVFFNHFHEAIVYFPLMLLALEMYMKDGKRGFFAVTVFLSALSNYYFFIGQVFFLLIYWFVRMFSGDWDCSLSKFLWLLFEAVVGTAGAAVFLLPSYLAVIQNPRTDSMLAGWDALIYNKPQRFYDIIHSFFFPQDIPARENFFRFGQQVGLHVGLAAGIRLLGRHCLLPVTQAQRLAAADADYLLLLRDYPRAQCHVPAVQLGILRPVVLHDGAYPGAGHGGLLRAGGKPAGGMEAGLRLDLRHHRRLRAVHRVHAQELEPGQGDRQNHLRADEARGSLLDLCGHRGGLPGVGVAASHPVPQRPADILQMGRGGHRLRVPDLQLVFPGSG